MKKIILVLAVIAVVGVAAYYYLAIYQPEQFGRNFLIVMDDMSRKYQELSQLSVEGTEIERARIILSRQTESFLELKNKISLLQSPYFGELSSLKGDMLVFLNKYLNVLADAKIKLDFSEKANLLKTSLEFRNAPDQNKTKAGEIVKYYDVKVAELKSFAQDFFSQTPPSGLRAKPTFEELKKLWQEVEPGFDIVLNFYRAKNPNLIAKPLTEKDFSVSEQAILMKMGEFQKGLNDFLASSNFSVPASPSPENLGMSEAEFRTLNDKINKTIEELRKKYQ